MEYAEFGDLQKVINEFKNKNTHIEQDQIMSYFIQICQGMKYLQQNNIIHRDLKVSNVFLCKNNVIKIGDFGISIQLENSQELAKTSVGTPYYLSPEICNHTQYSFKTDIWNLGCLLYELCTLKRPFQGDCIFTLATNILNQEINDIPDIYSKEINLLIKQLCNKNQEDRPSIDDILNNEFIQQQLIKQQEIQQKRVPVIKQIKNVTYGQKQKDDYLLNELKISSMKKIDSSKKLKKPILEINMSHIEQLQDSQSKKTPHSKKSQDSQALQYVNSCKNSNSSIQNFKKMHSPNRFKLFTEFIIDKMGKEKFDLGYQYLKQQENPIKALDQEDKKEELIKIIGDEYQDCIAYFKYLINSQMTPKECIKTQFLEQKLNQESLSTEANSIATKSPQMNLMQHNTPQNTLK